MGLLAAQMTAEYLTNYRHDLQASINAIYTAKMRLSATVGELTNIGSDLDPESEEFKLLEQRKKKLALIDKQLDQSMQRYQTQLASVDARDKSNQQALNSSIERSFTYGGK
jgi:DNA repair ATPase RecN